jgi:hypothetical protein
MGHAQGPANAFYKCQCCGGKIHSFEREDMLQEGIWKPQRENSEPGRFGYHINSMYSILSQETSFGSIAAKFLIAKSVRTELLNFVNGWLGEPWKEEFQYEMQEVELKVFEPSVIPDTAVCLMAIDVQVKGFWVLVRKFAPPSAERPYGESWLLFADFVETIEECKEIQGEYEIADDCVTMDMARKPNAVGRMIIDHNWLGVWGSDTRKFAHPDPMNPARKLQRIYSVTQFRDPSFGTKWAGRSIKVAPYVLFSKQDTMDHVAALRHAKPAIWHASTNVTPKYARHINSRIKRLEINQRTGKHEYKWHELHQDNHLLDCEGHILIRAMTLGLVSMPDETEAMNVS